MGAGESEGEGEGVSLAPLLLIYTTAIMTAKEIIATSVDTAVMIISVLFGLSDLLSGLFVALALFFVEAVVGEICAGGVPAPLRIVLTEKEFVIYFDIFFGGAVAIFQCFQAKRFYYNHFYTQLPPGTKAVSKISSFHQ